MRKPAGIKLPGWVRFPNRRHVCTGDWAEFVDKIKIGIWVRFAIFMFMPSRKSPLSAGRGCFQIDRVELRTRHDGVYLSNRIRCDGADETRRRGGDGQAAQRQRAGASEQRASAGAKSADISDHGTWRM
jgi:hypothetical protein